MRPLYTDINKNRTLIFKKGVGIFVTLFVIILLIFIGKMFFDSRDKIESQDTIVALGRIYELPIDDIPVVTTIKDVGELKKRDPEFYQTARDGDKVILFYANKFILLYRQEENRILKISIITSRD